MKVYLKVLTSKDINFDDLFEKNGTFDKTF